MILVTGGAGFIGSNFILNWFKSSDEPVINLDKLTYAGNLQNLDSLAQNKNYIFQKGDICNTSLVTELLYRHQPRAIIHFAAESHVDRSITGPQQFIETNVVGTFNLLECSRVYWKEKLKGQTDAFRFIHISTDEVFGSLGPHDVAFSETTSYAPNSPYSASKASSDHLVRAYFHTYGLPTITTNCSNNYGPLQFTEKLIPLMITNALQLKSLPIYGDGKNIRDWLFVDDHCRALNKVLSHGRPGETYNIGGRNEIKNIDVVSLICQELDVLHPRSDGKSYSELITFVTDRPGHDLRYAINCAKIEKELGWTPQENFQSGLKKTVRWYAQKIRGNT